MKKSQPTLADYSEDDLRAELKRRAEGKYLQALVARREKNARWTEHLGALLDLVPDHCGEDDCADDRVWMHACVRCALLNANSVGATLDEDFLIEIRVVYTPILKDDFMPRLV